MNEDLYKLIQQEGEQFDIRKQEIAEKKKAQTECSSRMVEYARSIFGVDKKESVENQITHRWKIDNFNEHNLQILMDRRKQLEDKWEAINKNYKIIIKLSNKQLRV